MKKQFIIQRYIIREIIPNYFVGLGFLSVLLFIAQIFYVIKLSVEKGIAYEKAFSLLLLYLPVILQITIPIAVIIASLLAIGRLSDDSEIVAMRACGISLLKIFLPTIIFGVFMTVFTLLFYEYIYPKGVKAYIKSKVEIYEINPTAELSRSLSYNTIDGIKITVDAVIPDSNELQNVRINYLNENKIIFARRALLLGKDYERNVFPLILFNATSQPHNIVMPQDRTLFDEQLSVEQTIYIPDRADNAFLPGGSVLWSLSEFVSNIEKRLFNLTIFNIRDINKIALLKVKYAKINKDYEDFIKNNARPSGKAKQAKYDKIILDKRIERKKIKLRVLKHKRIVNERNEEGGANRSALEYEEFLFHRKLNFALIACIFSLLGAPLGIFSKRAGKSLGFGISIIIIIAFFLMVFSGNFLVKNKYMTPVIAGWYPSMLLFSIGAILISIKLSGRSGIIEVINEIYLKIKKALFFFKRKINIMSNV